jgi:hypothetical protein
LHWYRLGIAGRCAGTSHGPGSVHSQHRRSEWLGRAAGPSASLGVVRVSYRQRWKKRINPESSQVTVRLLSNPKQKGLLWFRTYDVAFAGAYEIANPTPIELMIYVSFQLPQNTGGCYDVSFVLGDRTDRLLEEARAEENRFQLLATKPFVRRTLSDVTGKKNWHRWRGGSARTR